MGAAKVTIGELDLTTLVPAFPGVAIGVVLNSLKGDVKEGILSTNELQFLTQLTPEGTIKVGDDLGLYSVIAALQGTNRLYAARAVNGALQGGVVLASHAPAWQASTAYVLGDRVVPISPNGFVYECTRAGTSDSAEPSFPATIGTTVDDPDASGVQWTCVSARVGNFQLPIGYGDIEVEYDFGSSASTWQASASYATGDKVVPITANGFYYHATTGGQADSVEPTWPTTIGVTVTDGAVVWTCEGTLDDDALLLHQSDPGIWGNNIAVRVFNYAVSPSVVKVVDAFYVRIFRGSTQLEPGQGNAGYLCSRVTGLKDGYGQNIFVEDRLNGSGYIRAISNPNIETNVQPAEQVTSLKMIGGSDGLAVTDTHMVAAADLLANPADFPLTVLIDGGWATAALGVKLDQVASSRRDCVALLSTPFAAEDAASYMADIVAYRETTLALNSSWAALYSPHPKIRDKFNDRELYVAPDGYMAAIISKTGSNRDLWIPPAGLDDFTRIPVIDLRRRFTDGELDTLYDAGINPIMFSATEGIRPWGQKTLLTVPSALDRLNVRLLLLVIEPAIKLAMRNFLFKSNTTATRALAQARIEAFLRGIANAPVPGIVPGTDGSPAFRVQVDSQNNTETDIVNNKMIVWVFLRPARSVEEIPVTIILLNPGAELSLGV